MSSQKTIYILRHAKADSGSAGQDDHDRHLTQRGVDAARAMGQYFAQQGIRPDLVLCSTAARARETWDQLRAAHGPDARVAYDDRLYLASVNDMFPLISPVEESVRRLLIVGHNPGLHQLSLKLAKSGSAQLMDMIGIKFPTCAFAAVEIGDAPWRGIVHAHGELKAFVTPSMLGDLDE